MSELVEKLRPEFQDAEYRHAYAEECLNTMIATQIKVLREQRDMTQKQLADTTGMAQPRIPLLEDASYENWTIKTLKRFAKAFDVALSVKFETFSRFIRDFENLSRENLQRAAFPDDVQFHSVGVAHRRRRKLGRSTRGRRHARIWAGQIGQPQGSDMGAIRKPPKSAEGVATVQPEINGLGNQWAAAAAGRV